MSTITKEFTKEQLIEKLQHRISVASGFPESEKAQMDLELARIALASLEAESVSVNDDMAYAFHHAISDSSLGSDEVEEIKAGLRAAFANVTAPPAPVSVPAAMEMDDDFDSAFEHGKAVGWNAYRAAMLQGADRTNYRAIVERIAEIIHGKVTDIDLLTVTVKSMKDKLQK
ncbi:hypothetical protein SPM41_03145 [Enterobacter hormaechei subsp. xiangfangensis]|uniref:hypothetical protein n=1 Tax=Enterobacter hormaechei TaxID=158836 RepID=UPI002075F1F5|nr:hypothetical protein [Enterobacter hormaechei]MCM8014784.1 hypothetical protein [Enterobacter hormaechei]MCM8020182.1 hypothetical protein [Enterobacter hormaechei]MCW4990318.1 hypothetical protein [Enterobacter hormaechei subsp. xiangfangensis]MCW5041718.1 hypothetical protein [Enterobacter hormaechei subsp. xiangfangensis]